MPKGQPNSAKWFSVLSNFYGPDGYRRHTEHLDPPAFQVYMSGIAYMCQQGINYVPGGIPRMAVGPHRAKRATEQLLDLGFFARDPDRLGTYQVAHEGQLWRRGRAPDSRPVIPEAVRAEVYERDGFACVECQATEWLSLDHIWPYSKGGSDEPDNLRVLCRSCNSKKGARINGT